MKQILFFALLLFSLTASAQISTPPASPFTKTTTELGLGEITIEYSRPSVKDRTIFAADGLVPTGQLWRLGANSATKITFSEDVKINGNALEAGSYAVLATPTMKTWTFNFYTHDTGSWSKYKDREPVLSVVGDVVMMPESVETFMITTGHHRDNSALLEFLWDKCYVPLSLEVTVDEAVMANIDAVMAGPTAGEYHSAATYYHKNGKDLNKALEWSTKATSGGSPRFWQVHRKALILGDLGKKKEAIKAAELSLKLSKEANYDQYIKMNEEFIAKMKG